MPFDAAWREQMAGRSFVRSSVAIFALSATGCAHYVAVPLREASLVLAAPDLTLLVANAAKIDRPFLKPEAIELSRPLTPNALAVIAVIENPDLKALRTKSGVAEAQSFAARLLPDPTVQAGVDKVISGPDELLGFVGQLGFDLGALRKARVTRESGAAAARQVRLDLAWAEWQTAGLARLQGARISALQGQWPLLRTGAASAERWLAIAQRAAGRGDIAAADVEVRRLAAIDAADKARTAERELFAARGELNKLLGLPPETVLRLAPPAPTVAPPPIADLVTQAIDRRLDLAALRAGYGVAEATVHKAILDQFPTLSLNLVGGRDTAGNSMLGPQVGFTLPLWNRNRGGIAVASATRAQLRAEYDARLFQTRADIAAAVATLDLGRRQRAALNAQMAPIQAFAASSARAVRRGDLSLATAETAAQTLRDRQLALLQLDQTSAEAAIALELLTGMLSEGWTR